MNNQDRVPLQTPSEAPIQPTLWADLELIRQSRPLVHNITNYVVMNYTANALLALGASPIMAHATAEVAELVEQSAALVVNIGTLSDSWIEAMVLAIQRAKTLGRPIVIDPVGAGATKYRTESARKLINLAAPCLLRGNASEIMALCQSRIRTSGVDSSHAPAEALNAARELNAQSGCVVLISGATDYLVAGAREWVIPGGHVLMSRVTGMGCTATAVAAAFAAVNPQLEAAALHAGMLMKITGALAAQVSAGPGAFAAAFLDVLYHLNLKEIEESEPSRGLQLCAESI